MSKRRNTRDPLGTPYRNKARSADRVGNETITVSDLLEDVLAGPDSGKSTGLDNSSPVTIDIIKELMQKLEGNINARTDSKVDEVKNEVVHVKSHLDKFSDKFENMHERINNIEDQMEDFTQLESDLTSFKDQWDTSLSEINLEACRARKNNIIFQGIPGGNKDAKKSMNTFLKLCSDTLEMPKRWIEEVDVNECYCFPPPPPPHKGGKGNWPMFLSLAKSRHREDLYKNAYKLKDSGIYMQDDLAPCLTRKRKDLQKEANNL